MRQRRRLFGVGTIQVSALGIIGVMAGCGGEVDPDAVSVRDSLGVRIVESLRPSWTEGLGWEVGEEPLLRLGSVEGAAAELFNGVTGAECLGDGTIVVADGGSQEIRFFGSDGSVETVFGGPGEGPGEFSGLSAMGSGPGDQVWAYDFMLRRFTRLDSSGELVGLLSLGAQPPMLNAVGSLADGTFVLKQLWAANTVAQATEGGLQRDPVAVVSVSPDGEAVDTVTMVPGRELYLWDENGRGVMGTLPFAHNAVAAVWDGGVVVGDQVAFELRKFDAAGRLLMVARIPGRDVSLGSGDMEAYIRGRLEGVPEERVAETRGSIESMPVPDTKPAYGGILPDRSGDLWVSGYASGPGAPGEWTVLDAAGRWLGEVGMPAGFFPWSIGEGWILGVEQDDLGVEYVVLYPLRKEVGDGS